LLTAWTADALDQRDERMIPMRIYRGIAMTTTTNPNTSPDGWSPPIQQLLNHQTQLDADGFMVGVSRQAVEETLGIVHDLYEALNYWLDQLESFRASSSANQADAYYHFVKGQDRAWENTRAALSKVRGPQHDR
jgi:hypothetical protein